MRSNYQGWKFLMGTFLVIIGYVLSVLLAELVGLLFYNVSELLYLVVSWVFLIIFFTLAVKLIAQFLNKTKLRDYGLFYEKSSILKLFGGLALGIIAFLLAALPLYLTGDYVLSQGTGALSIPVLGFVSYVVVGYVEELLCRGYIQHSLMQYGPLPAMLITAGIFSALHLLNPNFSFIAFVNIFLAGTFMGAALYASKSLLMPIGIHITWNWVQGSVLGIPVSGGTSEGYFVTEIVGDSVLLTGGAFGAEGSIYCTVVLAALMTLLLVYAYKSGNMEVYTKMGNSVKDTRY